MRTKEQICLAASLPDISTGLEAVLTDISGADTRYVLFVINGEFGGVVGNLKPSTAAPALRQMLEALEKEAAQQSEPAPPPPPARHLH